MFRPTTTLATFTVITAATIGTLLAPSPGIAGQADSNILLVGNSFSKGISGHLKKIIQSSGRSVKIKTKAGNGWTLARHSANKSTLKTIASGAFDHVVLQEQSMGIWGAPYQNPRFPDARALDQRIRAAGATTVMFQTWRDKDQHIVSYDSLIGVPGGNEGYVPIAHELGAKLAPVGQMFRNQILDTATADLWAKDKHHASKKGQYIAALTIYASIFNESPVGLLMDKKIGSAECLRIQQLVADTVLGGYDAYDALRGE